MEKLVEISDPEVRIEFMLNSKCRANLLLRSLCATSPVAFKVQTSAPHKFLVYPPTGLIPPLSQTTLEIILKPQSQLPPTFPRSHSDRFLIKTAPFDSDAADTLNAWLSTQPTQDIKLKVAFVGPFLLQQAVGCGDFETARNLIKRQKSVLHDLPPREAESLLRSATELDDSEDMVNLLLEAGLRIDTPEETNNAGIYQVDWRLESEGWSELHAAAAADGDDRREDIFGLIKTAAGCEMLDWRDKEGRTPLHLAASKGNIECAKALVESGADKDAGSKDGRTALYRAEANGDRRMVEMLIEVGADPTIADDRGRSAIAVAREKGHEEIVEILGGGEKVLMAARRGQLEHLALLLQRGGDVNYCDQYGLTALHAAAIKGHKDVVVMLAEIGSSELDCQDNEGHTPLHMAVEGGHVEIVEALVEKGADVNAKSKRGATPLDMAHTMGHDDISKILMKRGNTLPLPSFS